ncbi:uncharacterized protein LOC134743492 [Cydia strobilella]|uniref:uncharacterized protein LOC134743492 n=1 Tax=Cydia strobilella TaxID=1100964 RepID=UPI00300797DB
MDINNVLEGTRQYFMGLPKQAQAEGSGQPVWPAGAPPHEEGAPGQSGAPALSSRPPSAAAAPPSTPAPVATAAPPRPPSEPLEPEPHIIHKATVMREAAEKRRELPEPEDDEEPMNALSPPTHIIRKPPQRTLPSPAPALAAPCPSPARPPSAAPLQPQPTPEPHPEPSTAQYRAPLHRVQTPTARPVEHLASGRPPDHYTASRPPEGYSRYHYDSNMTDPSRGSHGSLVASPQPSAPPRHSSPQQTYARLSSAVPQHATTRLRETATHSPPATRYALPATQPPAPHPHNDRVPPIHHPQTLTTGDRRSPQVYATLPRHESSHFARTPTHYERQHTIPPRKYDPQQSYPGYRQTQTAAQAVPSQRTEVFKEHYQVQYKHPPMDAMSAHYAARPPDRAPAPHPHDSARLPTQRPVDYPSSNRTVDARSSYLYQSPSTSSVRYQPTVPVPVVQNHQQTRTGHRHSAAPKPSYEYPTSNHVQSSARPATKPGFPSQQQRMTVSVTSLVNQMNQTKQKKESPLDLSVKTVKNSADSSTTVDDAADSASLENKNLPLQPRQLPNSRHVPPQHVPPFGASHKVDFAPDFTQYRETNNNHSPALAPGHPPVRYNGTHEAPRPIVEAYPPDPRHQRYHDRTKYSIPIATRPEYAIPRIDLTTTIPEERHLESRIRDDRHFVIEERKRPAGPIVSNIPEKIVRYETWTADSRISDRSSRTAREQHELASQPVYSYSAHKRYEAYPGDHKRPVTSSVYHEHRHVNHRYPYPPEVLSRDVREYAHPQYAPDRNSSSNSRQVIQKIPNHRDMHAHPLDPHSGVPADKRVLSILRNSLETKHPEVTRPRPIPELIVIDDVDDSEVEITDLTKENDIDLVGKNGNLGKSNTNKINVPSGHQIHMPKAIDSVLKESIHQKVDPTNLDPMSKSPENDVASRIRTKAELKVMPPSQDGHLKPEIKLGVPIGNHENLKPTPKSQKQHLFNQIREDLRLESVIKTEKPIASLIPDIKSEPMNIEEIEKDAVISIKTENFLDTECISENNTPDDLDWASACDNFMEQLKTGCHKKKPRRKRTETMEQETPASGEKSTTIATSEITPSEPTPNIVIKQEPIDADEMENQIVAETINYLKHPIDNSSIPKLLTQNKPDSNKVPAIRKPTINKPDIKDSIGIEKQTNLKEPIGNQNSRKDILSKSSVTKDIDKSDKSKNNKKYKDVEKFTRSPLKRKSMSDKSESSTSTSTTPMKHITKEKEQIKPVIKEESESTDDDEPLIKSKMIKEKERNERLKYAILKDMSVYVKLECCDVDVSKFTKKKNDTTINDKGEKATKGKLIRKKSRLKGKSLSTDNSKNDKRKDDTSSESEDEDLTVASRLRVRKTIKTEDSKTTPINNKTPVKSSPTKKQDNNVSSSASSTPARKAGFGDGSDFHPGWEEELYRYKRSLRMPSRLIAIPRGRSGGPFVKGANTLFSRGSTSLPDLDPAPLSPAPSSAPSAATDDLYARRPDKSTIDSDLDSNSSCSVVHNNRLHSDSEASTSTGFSTKMKKKGSSIVDVLMEKYGKKDEKKKSKDKEDKLNNTPKIIPKSTNPTELLPTPSLGLMKSGTKGILSAKKDKLMEDIYYLGAFRKETVSQFRNAFINNTDGLMGATEEFAPVVLKSRTRTESRVIKQRATIKEVFGDERPASAPPSSCRDKEEDEVKADKPVEIKKEPETKAKIKPKKIMKDKMKRRSSSIRDGLRSTKSLKRNDAKGRLMRLKKRNNLMKSLANKRIKDVSTPKIKKEKSPSPDDKDDKDAPKEEGSSPGTTEGSTKRRLKRLFGRRKFSSGFDYIRKKKKIIRRDDSIKQARRLAAKPSPESVHDIQKEIKGWFINKSIGESHLHRAARLGYTDCVAYCLEKIGAEPTAKDNAGFTPLHVAAAKGHVRIARLLLQYGANVSAAAQGGIRPLHEACENSRIEVIRLLLSYGADPLLGTYAGQTPEELAEGPAAKLLRLHIADVQGTATEPWVFPPSTAIIDKEELGCDALASPPPATPPPPPDATIEIQCTEAPLPPFYSLRPAPGQQSDGLWCLLQDITNLLQIKSKDSLLKQIHCGSGSPKELLREIRTQEFLERAQCHQLLCAGEKVNVRASKVALVRVTDKLRQLLKVETVLVS